MLCDLGPAIAVRFVQLEYTLVLCSRPFDLLDVGVEVIVPSKLRKEKNE